MKIPSFSTLTLIIFFISTFSPAATADGHDHFLECLSEYPDNHAPISHLVYTKANSSYTSILQAAIWNLRFTTESTPKPHVIIAPDHESQIPPIIRCAKQTGLEIRTRSGGHDMEGLSYRSQVPFVVIDLFNLGEVTVDAEAKTAWLGAGATLGALYYHISQKSLLLGFPAGFCPTVGSGGHFSGGGDGTMVRKYGMAADNIIDARIVDARGKILDRESMGEDLFWAIRGGGGASFGVIVAWKVLLVDVPETVTVFQVSKTLEQNATELVQKWQSVAPYTDKDLFVGILLNRIDNENAQRYVDWVKRYYDYMTPYVSSNPRSAYVNYRDLDFGVNNVVGGRAMHRRAFGGKRYYKNNFDRLVLVKTMVDPENFFRFEASIPPIHSWSSDKGVCSI
ncbi:cannabidiolic acid synthase-like [Salvia hispanica]|uniref:cannabidiolic acid synthase-like n=1 Tax=Salvia hispanica TaxID=49212 RepID=UPI0020092F58|nr:cannabidiolic acid synthase-like [Salvia hispanica]